MEAYIVPYCEDEKNPAEKREGEKLYDKHADKIIAAFKDFLKKNGHNDIEWVNKRAYDFRNLPGYAQGVELESKKVVPSYSLDLRVTDNKAPSITKSATPEEVVIAQPSAKITLNMRPFAKEISSMLGGDKQVRELQAYLKVQVDGKCGVETMLAVMDKYPRAKFCLPKDEVNRITNAEPWQEKYGSRELANQVLKIFPRGEQLPSDEEIAIAIHNLNYSPETREMNVGGDPKFILERILFNRTEWPQIVEEIAVMYGDLGPQEPVPQEGAVMQAAITLVLKNQYTKAFTSSTWYDNDFRQQLIREIARPRK